MAALSSSQTQVLGTPELLENILLHIDLTTLLVSAQLVERRWRNLINHFAVLQRVLFFRGDPNLRHDTALLINQDSLCQYDDDGNWLDDDWVEDRFEFNPLLRDKFRPFFHKAGPAAAGDILAQVPVSRFSNRPLVRSQASHLTREEFNALPLASDGAKRREAFMRQGASWRRMLVAQPPMQHLGFCGPAGSTMGYATCRITELRRPVIETQAGKEDGLRMGELYDAAVTWLTVHRRLYINWNPLEPLWLSAPKKQGRLDSGVMIDALFMLMNTIGGGMQDEFKEKFVYPGAWGRPPLQATKSLRWETRQPDGSEVKGEFGGVEYWEHI